MRWGSCPASRIPQLVVLESRVVWVMSFHLRPWLAIHMQPLSSVYLVVLVPDLVEISLVRRPRVAQVAYEVDRSGCVVLVAEQIQDDVLATAMCSR